MRMEGFLMDYLRILYVYLYCILYLYVKGGKYAKRRETVAKDRTEDGGGGGGGGETLVVQVLSSSVGVRPLEAWAQQAEGCALCQNYSGGCMSTDGRK